MAELRRVQEELPFSIVVLKHLPKAEMFQAHPKTASVSLSVSGSHSYALQITLFSSGLRARCAGVTKMYPATRVIEALRQKVLHHGGTWPYA